MAARLQSLCWGSYGLFGAPALAALRLSRSATRSDSPRHLAEVTISAIRASVSGTLRSNACPENETNTSVDFEPSSETFASTPAPTPPVFNFSYCARAL